MHTQIAYAPNGIPVRFNNKSEPLFSGLRKTLGLKTEKHDEKPAAEKTTITLRRPHQNTGITKGTTPIHPSTYEHCEGETPEEEGVEVDELLLIMNGSAEREQMGAGDRNWYREGLTGHRKNGKGGWIRRNLGQKPVYKDRCLRLAGSGKVRLGTVAS
ncbi:MAG: hypothetical protein ACAH17_00355 [Candidatus Paceibacterota bacterium]